MGAKKTWLKVLLKVAVIASLAVGFYGFVHGAEYGLNGAVSEAAINFVGVWIVYFALRFSINAKC